MNFKRTKKSWEAGLLTKEMLKQLYYRHVITLEEYKKIVALPQSGKDDDEE